ncbi:MAG TPA: protein-export chaperone SecB [Candidatus Macondimonas sp.]|jgi:preprotein translocase subunit SecB|nr:protein-export chaperone SecB [Candidatus Macondimonas sp.]
MEQAMQDSNTQRQLQILKVYLKDASFELPMGAALFGLNVQPVMKVDMDHSATQLTADQYEAVLRVSVTAQIEGKVAFMVEVHQAGLFLVQGLNTMELDAVSNAFFPNALFPYAREAISDFVAKGGLPQLLLAPVNFDLLYAQRLQQRQASAVKSNA